jgi:hypothetical protein
MENKESSNLEDNLPMVNYIMLHRIYDLLTLIATDTVGPEKVSKMVNYHDQGFLLGPTPSYTPNVEEKEKEEEEFQQDILDFEK